MNDSQPGLVILFGSGESQPSSGKTHEYVAQAAPPQPRLGILETPAGFEPNSAQVAEKIAVFLRRRLQNYEPDIHIIPARKKGTPFSPDDADIARPILDMDWLLLGPGSPTYAVRQLQNTVTWQMLLARHRLGATVMFSSSAVLAVSAYTMPVYEIYKVGQDLHWQQGLNFFGAFGLPLVVIPHWNNNDGGDELDTSRCYVGQGRFGQLRDMLPWGQTILGLDEHTSLVIDKAEAVCRVMGNGRVIILRDGVRHEYLNGEEFHPELLGEWRMPQPTEGIPDAVWAAAVAAQQARQRQQATAVKPPPQVMALVQTRAEAREQRDWDTADVLRKQIAELGWQVQDTSDGFEVEPLAA